MKLRIPLLPIICCIGLLTACNSSAQQTNLSVPEFEKEINQSSTQLLDVRTREEYESGHLNNALQADWTNDREFKERIKALDKHLPVYTYCLSGVRSGSATKWLNQNGYTAFNLAGGINAWKNANKPVEQAAAVTQMTMQEYLAQIPADKTVVVDFSAVWCPPCKKMAPVLDSLQETHGNKFTLLKIDGATQSNLTKELNINGFPTFIIYKAGKQIWRKEGITSIKEFAEHF